jgi:putative aldouronate transport system permease protein
MLYAMLVPPIAFFVVFRYVPMGNIVMAFKDWNIFHPTVWDAEWVGFQWFQRTFQHPGFFPALRNTIWLNFLDLVFGFPAPIILAILLNELAFKRFKKITQTIVYLPHFISWIIISGMAAELFAPGRGVVNVLLERMGMGPIPFLAAPGPWVVTFIGLGVWRSMGWGTIIYLAAITGINSELYEAAEVDGCGRWGKIRNVTLPGLRPTIVVLLILNLGWMLGSEFDRYWAMLNLNITRLPVGDVIGTMVYRIGILGGQHALTAAVGLFQSVVSVIFLLTANFLAKRLGERGIM